MFNNTLFTLGRQTHQSSHTHTHKTPHLGRVTLLGQPRSVYKSNVEHRFLQFWVDMAKWPWTSKSMTSIFNISWEYPMMHVWCKFGDSNSNLWRVIMWIRLSLCTDWQMDRWTGRHTDAVNNNTPSAWKAKGWKQRLWCDYVSCMIWFISHCGHGWVSMVVAGGLLDTGCTKEAFHRDHFVYAPSQREVMFQCNVVSH